ncbi:DUF1499 domain-containing protein [Candidatus Nitrotoga sp. M5]|uniref:DUF1499 domain-containing protein n=1 Tax=Candidatus Nitrotoga sp. M5 TaxID=2890409 RepID=UPI001EF65A72|nr:DUF1499 domain-containing protein [Candidatus Nitrotoga sp. M5]CAH1388013.1 conserved membrane hypothetical protein [Candidatus Nitrotoga sp. M5]
MNPLLGIVSFIAVLLVALPGPLYKYNIVELGTAFTVLRYGVYVGIAALLLLLIQVLFLRKNIRWAVAGISAVFAIIAVALPLSLMSKAKSVPPIHDISTDLINPPEFVAITALRANAPNKAEYAGEETAQQQRESYPELTTQLYEKSIDVLFSTAQNAVNELGWKLVNADKSQGIIEATDTTEWFGFKDDVVIRIRAVDEASMMDIRSKSRVGKSDLGKNAERIQVFIKHIDTALAR